MPKCLCRFSLNLYLPHLSLLPCNFFMSSHMCRGYPVSNITKVSKSAVCLSPIEGVADCSKHSICIFSTNSYGFNLALGLLFLGQTQLPMSIWGILCFQKVECLLLMVTSVVTQVITSSINQVIALSFRLYLANC